MGEMVWPLVINVYCWQMQGNALIMKMGTMVCSTLCQVWIHMFSIEHLYNLLTKGHCCIPTQ